MRKKHNATPAVQKTSKPEVKPKPAGKVDNPSKVLALLLNKEGMLAAKVRKAQAELRTAQAEIAKLWEERQEQSRELLNENPEE